MRHQPMQQKQLISNPSPNSSSPATPSKLLLSFTPNDTSVDYDENVTGLYEHIGNSNWEAATKRCEQYPTEAATWVVRYQRDAHGNKLINPTTNTHEVLWRFLPIHSACALNPPISFLSTLLKANTNSTRTLDDQGMLPLHYACGAKCTREVLYLLLMSFPQAALKEDPNGMLPLHYLSQWGPSEEGVIDMVCVATGYKVGTCKDGDGNTCEDLARSAEYSGNVDVANKIREFAIMYSSQNSENGSSEDVVSQQRVQQPYPNNNNNVLSIKTSTTTPSRDKYSSFEDADVELIDDTTLIEHEPEGDIEITSLCDNIGGSIPVKEVGVVTTTNNNENNQNTWNNAQMTPRSGRHAMMKLGVSPVNNRRNNNARQMNSGHPSPQAHRARSNSNGGLPPPSPRYVTTTPKSRNQKQRMPLQQQQQQRHQPDPHVMSEQERQDQRLSELRNELSGSTSSNSLAQHGSSGTNRGSRSTYSSSSQSSTSFGTQLNQQLQVFVKAEENQQQHTLSQNEMALKEEINRLRAEKNKAEAALKKATMLAPILSVSHSEESEDSHDVHDDGVSKLTFLEGHAMEDSASPRNNKHRQQNSMELVIQRAREEEGEFPSTSRANKLDSIDESSASKMIAELKDQITKEKAKSTELQNQVATLKEENESSIKSHGDTIATVKSLGKSLEKAKVEIEKLRSNKQDKEKNNSMIFEDQIKALNKKCVKAQNEEHKLRALMKDKELQWNEERRDLEVEIKSLKLLGSASSDGSLSRNSKSDSVLELQAAIKEADDMRKFNAAIRSEHDETIAQLETELTEERSGRTECLSQIVTLQYRIATLEQEIDEYKEEAKNAKLLSSLSSADSSGMETELSKLKKQLRDKIKDAEKQHKLVNQTKLNLQTKERQLLAASDDLDDIKQQLEASKDRVKQLEEADTYDKDVDSTSSSTSDQIRTLKKKIKKLQQSDDDNTQKLWEANKLHKRAMQDKEDEYNETIRDLKIKHEKILIEKEDEYLQEIRDAKKKTEQSFEEREASYIKQLRDVKKKEQAWTEREDQLLKQMNAEKLTSSFSELEIDNLMQQKEDDFKKSIQKAIDEKDEEFEKEVSKLKEEIERLKEEQVDADDDKAAVQDIKVQLKECKKELKQQQRKHKSEMAKIQNTMEMQKSKEGRLQSHIQSLEKQITDMVNEYESRLQDAFYG